MGSVDRPRQRTLLDPLTPRARAARKPGVAPSPTRAELVARLEEAQRKNAVLEQTCASLRDTQAELIYAEKVKAIGDIAAGVAHDYNNTLGAILARTQLALHRLEQSSPDTRAIAADLRAAEKIAAQGASSIERLQEFAGRREAMPLVSLNVNDVVRNAVELTRPKWNEELEPAGRRIEVVMELADVPPVRGFASDVTQVLSNLIHNAIDAMPGGGTLRFRTAHEAGHVVIDVVDDGEGIPEEIQPRLFKPFFTTRAAAPGLGLSIVEKVVAQHGGDVVVTSREGEGASFRIRLPAEGATIDAIETQESAAKVPGAFRILLVDDIEDVRESCRDMLIAGGHDVVDTGSGREAIAMIGPGRFDLVFTDLGMPDVTGFEVAREAKRRSPGLPVILLSGWSLEDDDARVAECEIDHVLAKPCTMSDLLEAVENTLRETGQPRGEREAAGSLEST